MTSNKIKRMARVHTFSAKMFPGRPTGVKGVGGIAISALALTDGRATASKSLAGTLLTRGVLIIMLGEEYGVDV